MHIHFKNFKTDVHMQATNKSFSQIARLKCMSININGYKTNCNLDGYIISLSVFYDEKSLGYNSIINFMICYDYINWLDLYN